MQIYEKVVFALLLFIRTASASRILALMLVPSHSHHLWNSKYVEALLARGHHVTYFSVNEFKNPQKNLSQIHVKGVYEAMNMDYTSFSAVGPYRSILDLQSWDEMLAELILKSEALQELNRLLRREKFDLVVHDVATAAYILGAVDVLGRPPVMGITAFGIPTWTLQIIGNPMAYSSKPYFYAPYSNTMTLLQRADNYFLHLFSFAVRWFSVRNDDKYSKKFFGKDIRPLEQILDDINVILVNSNYGVDYPFPKVPGLIPIGGLHIQEPKPLPQDLKTFLDGAKDGVIFFSLGSNIKSAYLGKKVDILTKAFKEIAPIKVLWKWDLDSLPNKPHNVKIGKWLPQNDILAHPNVRLFFTHSGLLSTQEAVYHGKPVVGMPFLLDQHANVHICLNRGFGEKLNFNNLSVESVVTTIRKILNDPRYTESARNASFIFRDQMESPLNRAVYWTEYVIRHHGAPHLRHSARNLTWYQNWMLDVMVLMGFTLYNTFKLLYIILWKICSSKPQKVKQN